MPDVSSAIRPVTILTGHTSPETALVVEDYPCGLKLRCTIRYWVEKAATGPKTGQQRFVSQTTNPKKNNAWNTPKTATYTGMVWMFRDHEGRVTWDGVGANYGVSPQQHMRYQLTGLYDQMPADDRKVYDTWVRLCQMRARPWKEWAELVDFVQEFYDTHGRLPVQSNGVITMNDKARYVYDWDVLVAKVCGVQA